MPNTMRLEFSLRLNTRPAADSRAYAEVAPYFVSIQLSQHVASLYHTHVSSIGDTRVDARVEGATLVRRLAATAPRSDSNDEPYESAQACVRLTFYSTCQSPDAGGDRRLALQAIGDLSIGLGEFRRSPTTPSQLRFTLALPHATPRAFHDACAPSTLTKAFLMPGSSITLVDDIGASRREAESGTLQLASAVRAAATTWRASQLSQQQTSQAMAHYDAALYRPMIHTTLRPVAPHLKWMHFPTFKTPDGFTLPSPLMMLLRPTGLYNERSHAHVFADACMRRRRLRTPVAACVARAAAFFESLFQCGLAVLRTQAPYSNLPADAFTLSALTTRLDALLAESESSGAPPMTHGENLFWCSLYGQLVALSVALYAQHNVYIADHANFGGGDTRVVERVRSAQEVGATDCEDGGAHPYMLTRLLIEQDWSSHAATAPLTRALARFMRLAYVPAIVNTTAASASAAPPSEHASGARDELSHTFALLLPRSTFEHVRIEAVGGGNGAPPALRDFFPLALTTPQRRRLALAPPLCLEGTALMTPLLAPHAAYFRDSIEPTRADEAVSRGQIALQREELELRQRLMAQFPTLARTLCHYGGPTNLDFRASSWHLSTATPTPTPRRSVRATYLSGERAFGPNFYRTVTHVWLQRSHYDAANTIASNGECFDFVPTLRRASASANTKDDAFSHVYGVPIHQLFLAATTQFDLAEIGQRIEAQLRSSVKNFEALENTWLDALDGMPALDVLAAPPPLARRFRTSTESLASECALTPAWEQLAQVVPASDDYYTTEAARRVATCFFVPIRSMELDVPSSELVALALELRRASYDLALRRLRIACDALDEPDSVGARARSTGSKEWVMFHISMVK